MPFSINFHYGGVKLKEINKKTKQKQKQGDHGENGIAPMRVVFTSSYRCLICLETLYLVFDVSINRISCVLKCYELLLGRIIGISLKKRIRKKNVSRTNTIYWDNCFKLLFAMKNSFYFIESEVSLVIPFLFLNKKNHSRQETWKQLMYKKATSY